MINSGKLFYVELKDWLINEAGFKKSQLQNIYITSMHQMGKNVVLSYIDYCVYWYT